METLVAPIEATVAFVTDAVNVWSIASSAASFSVILRGTLSGGIATGSGDTVIFWMAGRTVNAALPFI